MNPFLRKERSRGAYLVSIAIHIVVGAALLWVLSIPLPLDEFFMRRRDVSLPIERISFIQVPNTGANTPGRSGGDGRPVRAAPPAPIIAPNEIPSEIAPAPASTAPESGSGPVIGRGGPLEGITPSYTDPRIWSPDANVATAPRTLERDLDSLLANAAKTKADSLAIIAAQQRRGTDWTFEKGGKKYGLDGKNIYVANLKIPAALLALLPINQQANPQALERGRALAAMNADIAFHAQRAMNEEEFQTAVKRIRERKERERREKVVAEQKEGGTQ
ncbi:MAG TPA: hypothetical protein VJ672_00465 [Gemmatimonadaceae bacterium]|nr:hypothetical protein [Gemmatimonadaceae bacterium]